MSKGIAWSDDGNLSLQWDSAGLPEFEGHIPAPFRNELQREEAIQRAINDKYLNGFWVERKGRIRNIAFDKEGEKTSERIIWRVCKTEDEAKFVIKKVEDILMILL